MINWKTILLSIIAIIFVYHIIVVSDLQARVGSKYDINLITNVITMKHERINKGHLGEIIAKNIAVPIIERMFNDKARQFFDIYTMIIPYRVIVEENY